VVITANNRKNPKLKAIISGVVLLSIENPTITGMSGRTQGDIIDAIPAKKDNKKLVSISHPSRSIQIHFKLWGIENIATY
jgi:hypothetical protein